MGCRAEGVLACNASGAAKEHTERRSSAGAVVVVLARMPGVCAVPFAGAPRRAAVCCSGVTWAARQHCLPTALPGLRSLRHQRTAAAGKSPPKPRGAHNKMPLPLSAVPWPPLQEALASGVLKCVLQQARATRRAARLARWQLERVAAGEGGCGGRGDGGRASNRAPGRGDGGSERAGSELGGTAAQPGSGGGSGECADDQSALDGADALGLEGLRVLQRLQGQQGAGGTTQSGDQQAGSGAEYADADSDSGSQGVGGSGGSGGGAALALQPGLVLLLAMPTDWGGWICFRLEFVGFHCLWGPRYLAMRHRL